jgi:hypothetical protein
MLSFYGVWKACFDFEGNVKGLVKQLKRVLRKKVKFVSLLQVITDTTYQICRLHNVAEGSILL